jgi:O-antigen ligase
VSVLVVALQLVPLPIALHDLLSPHAAAVDRAIRFGERTGWQPLTLQPPSTAIALFVDLLALAVFWIGRDAVAGGGVRPLARTILGSGLVVSVVAIVVAATNPPASHLVYGLFEPTDPSARPYGPFINRNEMATWMLLALPLVIGYAVARGRRRSQAGADVVDATMVWFGGGAIAMLAALVFSLSRSGIIAAVAEAFCFIALALKVSGQRRTAALAAGGIVATAVLVALAMPRTSVLIARFDRTLTVGGADARTAIWRDTRSMIRDFPLTGVGAGAYPIGMLVYQQGSRLFFNNHAHDQYLQILAEGGALVAVPLAVAAFVFAGIVAGQLRADRTAGYWIRAGAATGLVGVLLQSIWEVGLAAPANAVLFAAVCAVAIYRYDEDDHDRRSPGFSR